DPAPPEPIVPRELRRGVDERIAADGTVVRHLDTERAQQVIADLLAERVESIAICLLHSYRYSQHEEQLRALVQDLEPQLPVSLSHEVLPHIREFERSSATAINAYVQPIVHRYLYRMRQG